MLAVAAADDGAVWLDLVAVDHVVAVVLHAAGCCSSPVPISGSTCLVSNPTFES